MTDGSGVSRISARGVLKVRPHMKRGGGGSPLQVRHTKSGGGGGGGGVVRFRSDTFVWHTVIVNNQQLQF